MMKRLPGCLLLLFAACSLAPPPPPAERFWSADPTALLESTEKAPGQGTQLLRLRGVGAAPFIGEIPLWRSGRSYGHAGGWRWLEAPRIWLEKGIEQWFFENGLFRRRDRTTTAALEAELVAFEEIRGDRPGVRVGLRLRLEDGEGSTLLQRTLTVERDLSLPVSPSEIAEALAEALAEAIREAAAQVGTTLESGPVCWRSLEEDHDGQTSSSAALGLDGTCPHSPSCAPPGRVPLASEERRFPGRGLLLSSRETSTKTGQFP